MASIVIHEAPAEVVQQAQSILESHHEHLLKARILFLFSNAKATSRGKVLPGKGKKLSPEQRFLSSYRGVLNYGDSSVEEGYDFIVTIYEHQWHGLLKTQRAALLDHLLCWRDFCLHDVPRGMWCLECEAEAVLAEAGLRPREEIPADLDARDAALDAATSLPDEAGVASEVSQDVEDVSGLHAQKASSGAISATNGTGWRERAGIGRTARPRHS